MKKLLIGIFAHPDDESFGPSGTLLKLRHEGYDIHLILLTDGDAGVNIDNVPNLATARLTEWQTAANILDTTSSHALHYPDGELDKVKQNDLDTLTSNIINDTIAAYSEEIEISFMTFEPQGLTGHRDHIAASKLATRMANKHNAKHIWYFCLDSSQAPLEYTAYYEPRASTDSYITHRVDITPYLSSKYKMIDAHISQRKDALMMKKIGAMTENFHIESL
jgi:LmbE family N-acetylglucosaminyl deacetylase